MKPEWIYKVFCRALEENDIDMRGLAKRMGRSQDKAWDIYMDAWIKTELFTELMDELGYDVCVVRRADGERTDIEVNKRYRRVRRK